MQIVGGWRWRNVAEIIGRVETVSDAKPVVSAIMRAGITRSALLPFQLAQYAGGNPARPVGQLCLRYTLECAKHLCL